MTALAATPLRMVGRQAIDFEPEVTADDIAVMDLLLLEDCISRFRKNAAALPAGRIADLISAGERLAAVGKETLS